MKKVLEHINTIASNISKPIVSELPFFVATFLLWSVNTLLDMKVALLKMAPEWLPDFFHYIGITILYVFFLTCIICWLKKRWIKILLYCVSIVVTYIILALRRIFDTSITPDILQIAAETNTGETSEFLNNYAFSHGNITALIVTILFACFIVVFEFLYHRKTVKRNNLIVSWSVMGLILLCLPCMRIYTKLFSCQTFSDIEHFIVTENDHGMDNLTSILYSIQTLHISSKTSQAMVEATLHEINNGNSHCINPDTLNVIIVIGESYNKRHAGIYGYSLNTTPRLHNEVKNGNLIVFNDVISPYNTTSHTLKEVLTATGRKNNQPDIQPLAVAVFRRAGYDVAWWDNQMGLEKQKNIFSFSLNSILFNPKIDDECYSSRNKTSFYFDGDLIDDFIKSKFMDNSSSQKRLLVFHLMGQHLMAKNRYPFDSIHNHFTADSVVIQADYIDDTARENIAHYDNATLYNDEVIIRIIDLFRYENTVLVYFSDHGEEVYDYRYSIGRNHSDIKSASFLRSQNDIPFIVWYSDKYATSHPDVVTRLKNAVNRPFMNTDLVQILYDLGEIETPFRDEKYNPISSSYTPATRIVYDNIDYDNVVERK